MPTPVRRKSPSVVQRLVDAPYAYPFQQAMRLLERAAVLQRDTSTSSAGKNPVARFSPPATECIRLSGNSSLAFPAAEVVHIKRQKASNHKAWQWHMLVNVMSLTGAMGVLPYHYTELLLKRSKQRDEAMARFFDLFAHRSISLFFQAGCKYRLPLQHERARLHEHDASWRDAHAQALLSLIGLGTGGLNGRLHTRDASLIYYGGLFTQSVRSAVGLQRVLRSHFKVPVAIEQFIGQWQPLVDDVRTRLRSPLNPKGRNACLGRSALLGRNGWFAQGKIRVILGPLDEQRLSDFAPGTSALQALHELTRFYVGLDHDYEFRLRVREQDFPNKPVLDRKKPLILGWNTRLACSPGQRRTGPGMLEIAVSSRDVI